MIRSTLSSWREYLTPVSHKSTFLSTGEITPDEFVEAGDYMSNMFPTWSWNEVTSDISYRDFLPRNKQFLMTRKVPSNVRAQQFVNVDETETEVFLGEAGDGNGDEEQEGWIKEGVDSVTKPAGQDEERQGPAETDDIDEMMKDMEIEGIEDIVDLPVNRSARFYDLYITYSTSYRVPKMYIVGFDSDGTPLTAEEMFEDIAPDYRTKTATIEKLPFYKTPVLSVSIHPCRHANVMKILLDKVRNVKRMRREEQQQQHKEETGADDWEDLQADVDDSLRVDQYLVIFLKFITSVTPSIEHDYTMEGW
ncbi:hypothetical protein HG536_0A08680 [Torulaspora globosa]|uniref:Autophagy-related protein 3 n=1 Tax=Torulaspora globosa TaxID=48254 RepID=A0A7G3ZC15_9SACH|nr:uncharacterized protein HG536_0A08680 [Torulaspora globosa]QLL31051.1 hypothetical protein HG536_0A08680 [Torulaspora globosa]